MDKTREEFVVSVVEKLDVLIGSILKPGTSPEYGKWLTKTEEVEEIIDQAIKQTRQDTLEEALNFFEKHNLNHLVGNKIVGIPRHTAKLAILQSLKSKTP